MRIVSSPKRCPDTADDHVWQGTLNDLVMWVAITRQLVLKQPLREDRLEHWLSQTDKKFLLAKGGGILTVAADAFTLWVEGHFYCFQGDSIDALHA